MADLDPAHANAVGELLDDLALMRCGRSLGILASSDIATDLLTSTDPAVHAALLAALVRAGVLEEERESATLRMFGGKVVMRKARSRFVAEWEETCD